MPSILLRSQPSRLLLFCTLAIASFQVSRGFQQRIQHPRLHNRRTRFAPLRAASDDGSKSEKPKGVYVRPSAVIERGSGFFFPGLEGPRVRLFVGSGLLVATALNHEFSASTSAFSEAIGVFYSLLVLLQGAIETSKEARIESISAREGGEASASSDSNNLGLFQQWTSKSDNQEKVEWAAATYLSLTSANHVVLIENDSVRYWLGETAKGDGNDQQACLAALKTIGSSKGGRVALPLDHPATALVPDTTRCVLLQRISPDSCWMVASDDLLASFTKSDLQWLGQLAAHVA